MKDGTAPDGQLDAAKAQLRRRLRIIGSGRLSEDQWNEFDVLVRRAREALATGDLAGIRQAAAEVAGLGGDRIVRLGSEPVSEAPPPVRERLDEILIDTLVRGERPDPGPEDESADR